MIDDILEDAELRMMGAISSLEGDLATYRTGRANPTLLDRIMVDAYGAMVPLNQVASVGVPEPQQLAIKPYDANQISAIERAILTSDLGLTPNNDGRMIRLNIPPLTEERRRDLAKSVSKRTEEGRVSVRNVRRDAQNEIRKIEKAKEVSEDQAAAGQESLQKLTDSYIEQVETLGKEKETEIMTL